MKILKMRQIALDCLLLKNDEAVYKKNGISKTTFYRITKTEEFKNILKEQSENLFTETALKAQAASLSAIEVLKDIMENKDTPAPSRIAASKAILDRAAYFGEYTSLLSKIEELKEMEERRCLEDYNN